ncbi:uncharacterized protein BO97DRAFT_348361 [Aspergillus homomorphus CBS 101889]|uniref:Fe2OG dioxygenase domain-containing protein n=1 Tax=Aspergillus homomorphus (strain CBS 101889) TaxID=1450537 RepID=A0A395HTM4_ASPHC|nr:hypothetical protein BO97DRAFT_348361 [Aspergillus homomorphus CBS 101889]RAL10906.1 hypothetical protein BO97DRAFT_348361 [Aspergillus homomorphus CBS 101889]
MPKKTPQPKTKPPPNPPKETQSQIQWPPLPPTPKSPYFYPSKPTLQPLVDSQIYLIPNFFPQTLCKTYTSFLASLPLVTTPKNPKRGDAVRVNDRFQVQDEGFAAQLWELTALKRCVTGQRNANGEGNREKEAAGNVNREVWGGEPLGLNGNIRIYRYSRGQFFDKHYDDSNTLTFNAPGQPARPARTTWTLLIYLTGCEGGETVFYPEPTRKDRNPQPVSVAPVPGMALLHRHGEHCMLHEGKEVLNGEKWVLRSDLVVAR